MPTLAEQFAGRGPTTQLGQALEAAAIAWVAARSPQAKGRIERLWGTAQDRLRIELRLAGVTTREEANALLPEWIDRHNERFAVAAVDPGLAWRPVPGGLEPEAVFCFRHSRRVARDGTFTLAGESLMLSGRVAQHRLGRRLVISERIDGSRWVEVDGAFHRVVPAPERPATLRRQGRSPAPAPEPKVAPVPQRPAAGHPWRRYGCLQQPVTGSLAAQAVKVAGPRQPNRPTIQTVAAGCATSHGTLEAKTQSASGGPSGRARPTLPASGALVGSRSKGSATSLSSNRARRMALEP